MIFGLCLLAAIYLVYLFLIKGLLWKMLLAAAGWIGIYYWLSGKTGFSHTIITIGGMPCSWAILLPTLLVLLAMMYTKD